jgi:2-phospho-L-lactate guanylyltransferase
MIDSTLVVIPVKLNEAKSRLSQVFSVKQRQGLVLAMIKDVTSAVTQSKEEITLCLLSRDTRIENYASQYGYVFIRETHHGLNASIRDAVNWASKQGFGGMLVVPSDVPLVTTQDINCLLKPRNPSQIVITPSNDGGTNALLRQPIDIIPTCYGEDSYRKHIENAKSVGCMIHVYESKTLALDLDTPQDVNEFVRLDIKNNTREFIDSI